MLFLQLIVHDTRNGIKAAFKIVTDHYATTEKPQMLALYETLMTRAMNTEEGITGCTIRVDLSATGLGAAGEQIRDNLVIPMIRKGLPESYKLFVVICSQLDRCETLTDLKAALLSSAK